MSSFFLLTFFLGIDGILGASIKLSPSCELVIDRNGVESLGSLIASGGDVNHFYCAVRCPPGRTVSPSIQWFRVNGAKSKPIKVKTNRVHAYNAGMYSRLTFTNFLERDVGLYKCKAWLGGVEEWVKKTVDITYGCHSFLCDSNRCLPKEAQCNRTKECKDGTDEENCGVCGLTEFMCNDGECIDEKFRCDGYYYDCEDSSDEKNCSCNIYKEFTCGDGTCISKNKRCDGAVDCIGDGGSDEDTALCESDYYDIEDPEDTTTAGPISTFTEATTTTTIQAETTTTTPEATTTAPTTPTTPKVATTLAATSTMVESTTTMDVSATALPKTNAATSEAASSATMATTTTINNAASASDSCEPGEFMCDDGECIKEEYICDDYYDCKNNEDEKNCGPTTTFTKATTTTTIKTETTTTTPEATTTAPATPKVTTTLAATSTMVESTTTMDVSATALPKTNATTSEAVSSATMAKTTAINNATSAPECDKDINFKCAESNDCIPIDWYCDSDQDCEDNSDEMNCPMVDGCLMSEFNCGEDMCIPQSAVCDGNIDCPRAEDEEACTGCTNDQFKCGNDMCIPASARCDSFPDCDDGSDEAWCFTGLYCPENMIACQDQKKCYNSDERCNGQLDCADGSDEASCATATDTGATATDTGPELIVEEEVDEEFSY